MNTYQCYHNLRMVCVLFLIWMYCTIFVRFNVAYGAPAPREGVRRREGGTLGAGGYTRVLPPRGYRANPNPDHNPNLTQS